MDVLKGLGVLERVELKEVWEREGEYFTPWLAEHISLLGDALGLDLENMSSETSEEECKLHVPAWDVGNDRLVVIENHLEATENAHLGQLLTCAAVHDADVVVWVAKEFKSEHKHALDMLNRRTDEDTEFYGVAVELWRIDGSRPAPYFHVVASPGGWEEQVTEVIGSSDEENDDQQGAWEDEERFHWFWEPLKQKLEEAGLILGSGNGQGHHCMVDLGMTDVWCDMRFTDADEVVVDIRIHENGIWNDSHLGLLKESQLEIEAELGMDLVWEGSDDHGDWSVSVSSGGSINEPSHRLDEIRDWMFENVVRFNDVFPKRLANVRDRLSQEEDGGPTKAESEYGSSWAFGMTEPISAYESPEPVSSFVSAPAYDSPEPVSSYESGEAYETPEPVSLYGSALAYDTAGPASSYDSVAASEPVSTYESAGSYEATETGDSYEPVQSYGLSEFLSSYRPMEPSQSYGSMSPFGSTEAFGSSSTEHSEDD